MALLPGAIKFTKFLKRNKIPKLRAAKALGATHVSVLNWTRGRAAPTPTFRKKIAIWTHGEVAETDWVSPTERKLEESVADVKPFEPEGRAGAAE